MNISRRARDAVATVDRLIELLDNPDIEAALMRVDRRNSFELVTIRAGLRRNHPVSTAGWLLR